MYRFILGVKARFNLFLMSLDPMEDILGGEGATDLFSTPKKEGDEYWNLYTLLDLKNLWQIVKRNAVMLSIIAIIILIIALMYVRKADLLAEKKAALTHVIFILLLICSLVPIMNALKAFFDYIFLGG